MPATETTKHIPFTATRALQETRKRGDAVKVATKLKHSPDSKLTAKWAREPETSKTGTGTGRECPFEKGVKQALAEDAVNHSTGSGLLFLLAWRIRQQRRKKRFVFSLPSALMFLTKAVSKAALVCCSPSATQKQKEAKAWAACVAMMEFFQCILSWRDAPQNGELKKARTGHKVLEVTIAVCKEIQSFARRLKKIEKEAAI